MTIPNKSQFIEFINALNDCNALSMTPLIESVNPTYDSIYQFITKSDLLTKQKLNCLDKTVTAKWLCKQSSFNNAIQKLFSKAGKKNSSVESIDRLKIEAQQIFIAATSEISMQDYHAENRSGRSYRRMYPTEEEFIRYMKRHNEPYRQRESLHYFLNAHLEAKQLNYLRCIGKSLFSYYHTERWKEILKQSKHMREDIENSIKYIAHIESLKRYDEFLSRPFATGFISNLKGRLESELSKDIEKRLPITRNDKTIKERTLVYDLWKGFYGIFRRTRLKPIMHLLELEGIKHSLETRTVERMIQRWSGNQKRMTDI